MTYTAVVRQRGQLTIPDKVRQMVGWLQTGAVVIMEVEDEEVRIKPYAKSQKKTDKPLSQFIIEDRENH